MPARYVLILGQIFTTLGSFQAVQSIGIIVAFLTMVLAGAHGIEKIK
jgi:hypothetical protein